MATTAIVLPPATTARSIALSHPTPATGKAHLSDAAPSTELRLPCQLSTPDLWFAQTPHELDQAKHLCGGCPIRAKCLAGALHRQEPYGVWGGEILHHGTIVAPQPTRRRPRTTNVDRSRSHRRQAVGHRVGTEIDRIITQLARPL